MFRFGPVLAPQVPPGAHSPPRTGAVRVALGGLLLLGLTAAESAWALRCDGDLVREGDPAYRVREACGPPDHITPLQGYPRQAGVPDEELWYYNFGPNQLVRELHFRNGRLVAIRTSSRGFREPESPGHCRPNRISTGMSGYELRSLCGPPDQREAYRLLRPLERDGIVLGHRQVWVEDWYYDFGSRYLDRRVRLEDGRVQRVETVD